MEKMFSEGYVTFDGIDCIYILTNKRIKLIPTQKDDIRKLNRHFDDQHFMFYFSDFAQDNCIAYIDRVEMGMGHSLTLIPQYVLRLMNDSSITSMQITGAAIDEIFHPASYYYMKAKCGDLSDIDLIHDMEVADKWKISVDGKDVVVCLQYGGFLRRGILSDIKLHPQLVITFPPTTDYTFLFKIYSIITRFLQLTQYNSNIGECKVYLEGCDPERNSGFLTDWTRIENKRNIYSDVEYRFIKPYIGYLLNFSANNSDISLSFLPSIPNRWRRNDYSPHTLITLFAAFESEYKANVAIYEMEPPEDISGIKRAIVLKMRECSDEQLSESENTFLLRAENSIQSMGNQVGQTQKIKNVIRTLNLALKSSAEHLFVRGRIGSKEGFSEREINTIAKKTAGLRGKVSHDYSLLEFDDLQTEYVHFLEILVHAQMLKRAGIDDVGIEIIIGNVFHCNNLYMDNYLKIVSMKSGNSNT